MDGDGDDIPEKIGNARPPGGICSSARGAGLLRNHKGQTPSLWRVSLLRVQFWSWVGLFCFGGCNALTGKVGELWDLVLEKAGELW